VSARDRSAIGGVVWRTLHNFITNPAILFPSIVFPLFFFASFAGGLSSVGDAPTFDYRPGYTAFQFVFVFIQSAAFGGVFTGFAMASDWEGGMGRRIMLATANRRTIIVGYALAAMARWLLTALLLFGIALLVGMPVDAGPVDLLGLIGLGLVVNLAATMWASGIALRFRSIQAGSLMQTPVFLALFLAPVYVPRHLLTGWVEAVARFNPFTAILEAGRGFLAGDPVRIGLAFAAAAALALVLMGWSRLGMRAAERAG
jgi:ABC-2 type transport system permease protein